MKRHCLIVGFFGLCIAGCGAGKSIPTVEFVQFASTMPLDECREGFKSALAADGFVDGKTIKFLAQNAHGDIPTTNLMMQKARDDGAVLVGTSGTPALQAATRTLKDVPIVFTAVIDPLLAGAGPSLDKPSPNVTGIYNPFPIAEGIDLVHEIMPKVKVIGSLYDTGEPFGKGQEAQAKAECDKLGLTWVSVSVTSPTDIVPGVQAMKERGVEAMMQLPSNTMNQAVEAQVTAGKKQGIPMFSLQTDQLKLGVVAALGINFTKAGEEAGHMAAQILKGAKPSDLPLKKTEVEGVAVNQSAAKDFGITIPASVLAKTGKS